MPTGLFRATHPHNPTLYSHIGVGHIIEMVYTVKMYGKNTKERRKWYYRY